MPETVHGFLGLSYSRHGDKTYLQMKIYYAFVVGVFFGGFSVAIGNTYFYVNTKPHLANGGLDPQFAQESSSTKDSGDALPKLPALSEGALLSADRNTSLVDEPQKNGNVIAAQAEDQNSYDPETRNARMAEQAFIATYDQVASDAVQQIQIIVTQAMARGIWSAADNAALRPYSIYITPDTFNRIIQPLFDAINSGALSAQVPVEI